MNRHRMALLATAPAIVALLAVALPARAGSVGDDQADAVWGEPSFTQGGCPFPPPTPSASSLCIPADAVADTTGNLWIVDINRVLMYPPGSTTATKVFGQGGSFTSGDFNHGGLSAFSIGGARSAAIDGNGTLYVADSGNNRVLVYFHAANKPPNPAADLVLGQADFVHDAANGNTGNGAACPAATTGTVTQCSLDYPESVSLDASGDLLVTDGTNNRVLLWPASDFNPANSPNCSVVCYLPATMVWGQFGSFSTNGANEAHTNQGTSDPCPTNASGSPSACTLSAPRDAVADAQGNLYIADWNNNRVLEYDEALTTGTASYRQVATMVYGQGGSFTSNTCALGGVTASSLCLPYGVAFDPAEDVWVIDQVDARVLEYPPAVTGNRSLATTAIWVLGQRGSFTTGGINEGGLDGGALSYMTGISFDGSGNAYIADTGNSRVLEFFQPYPITERIGLATGWNLVALTAGAKLPYSAASAINQIDQEGGNASMAAIYRNGAYQVYVPGFATNFSLDPHQGFWVLATKASVWAVT